MTALVWIQREFRVDYLPALQAALSKHDKVIVAYFHDHTQRLGAASALWLSYALDTLQSDYQQRQGALWIIEGDFATRFRNLLQEQSIAAVYYSFQVGQAFSAQQEQALQICRQEKIYLTPFYSEDFFIPAEVTNLKGSPYLVFTPYYKNCLKMIDQLQPLDLTVEDLSQTALVKVPENHRSVPPSLLAIRKNAWARKMMQYWQISEAAAWQVFEEFADNRIQDYEIDRDFPSIHATSRLSPYLHFGHLSPSSVYFYLLSEVEAGHLQTAQIQPWIRQLFWRNFARYLLVWFPDKERRAFNDKYANMSRDEKPDALLAWQQGQTGIPIIDAGMRELWETGTMHNRVRMLVASLLSKNLNLDWRNGLKWFEDTLFDADPANNSMGWQWVAGCGVDAAPYYRLFNPVVQSQKFDANGEYIKKWLPELQALSAKAVHAPWQHEKECKSKGLVLGTDYSYPIVDLTESRQLHLQRVNAIK